MIDIQKFHWPCWPQILLLIILLCLAGSNGQAQNQPIEQVWSPSYSVEAKSVMANDNGWWVTGGVQLPEDYRYRPVLLHWQPSADSFAVQQLKNDSILQSLSGDISSLQKLSNDRIAVSTNYYNACDVWVSNPITNKAFLSTDSSSTVWQFNEMEGFNEVYTFPSDTSLVFADSLYVVSPNGQPLINKGYSDLKSVEHVTYQKNEVGIITEEGLSLYNQQGAQLHKNTSINPIDAIHWQGDTIAATDGQNLYYLNDSLNILAQKSLSSNFASAPVLTTWQDRLLLAGLNPQQSKWRLKSMTMNQQMTDLVAFGDSSWVLKDMYVQDSILGITGVQQKVNSNALLFKTVHLPDTTQDRSLDVALKDIVMDNVSLHSLGGSYEGLFNLNFNVYCKVQNNSTQDTITNLSTFLGFRTYSPCPLNCNVTEYHHKYDSLMIPPGESKMVLMDTISDYCVSDSVTMEICPVVMAANERVDPDMSNNRYCDTLTAVGIETPSSSDNIRIYPTYVRDKLIVATEARVERATIRIHDSQGRLIHRSKMTGNRQTIDLHTQPTGVYIATITTPNGKHSRKFVIGE